MVAGTDGGHEVGERGTSLREQWEVELAGLVKSCGHLAAPSDFLLLSCCRLSVR